jgi:hypothetical protein
MFPILGINMITIHGDNIHDGIPIIILLDGKGIITGFIMLHIIGEENGRYSQ